VIPSPEPPTGPSTDRRIDISLRPAASAPTTARRELERVRGQLDDGSFEDLRLVVSELVANAVLHAGLHPVQRISVRLWVGPARTRVEVEDPGGGFRPRPARGPDASDGRGLVIVDRLARDWGVARGDRTMVWAELRSGD
jgi:anti-sigma regulatory factor (Ser/Thr protein kinase)